MATAITPQTFTVSGHIFDEFNTAISGAVVHAYEKDLRRETILGSATSNAQGFYTISFNSQQSDVSEYKSPDVFIRVTGSNQSLLGQSAIVFNIPGQVVIDFKTGNGAIKPMNEFDALLQLLQPLVSAGGLQFKDLVDNEPFHDISFLAGETGADATHISLLVKAHQLSDEAAALSATSQTGNPTNTISLPAPFIISPAVFYAWLRLGSATDLNTLLHTQSESLRKTLLQAIDENIISGRLAAIIDKALEVLNQLLAQTIVQGDDSTNEKFTKTISATLSTAELQQTFIETYFANEATPEKFWEQLALRPGFTDGKAIEDTKALLRINLLTGKEPALTNLLYREQQQDEELKDMRGITKFTRADWMAKISGLLESGELTNFPEGITGETTAAKTENYASALEQLTQKLYPTTFFAQRLKQDDTEVFGDVKNDLITFLNNNPGFDLKTNSINTQFAEANYEGIEHTDGVNNELKTLNRLHKLTDDYNAVSALRTEGLQSASAIINGYSRTQFSDKFSEVLSSSEKAKEVYNNALSINNKTTAMLAAYKTRHDIKLYAIDGDAEVNADYQTMFGDGEMCECEHCQSVYSPAAYFADILKFIKDENVNAFNKLISRRPDLDDILLTCKNTNTPLPYIDLVNELLEKKVFRVLGANNFTSIAEENYSYQTEGLAAELAAMPEHINMDAYAPLLITNDKTVFSSLLPFDLPLEEIRIYAGKLGYNRFDLMESIYGNNEPGKFSDTGLAAELFEFSKAELDLINGAASFTVELPLNLAGRCIVKTFLEKTKLSYLELLQLLETDFLNPRNSDGGQNISIEQPAGAVGSVQLLTCNLEKLFVSGGSDAWLNKLVRFARLWKKLGWDIFDLDRALTAISFTDFVGMPEDITTNLLLPLSHIERIRRQLNIPLREILTLIANIDTITYRDHSAEGQPEMASMYEQLFLNKTVADPVIPAFVNLGHIRPPLAAFKETLCAVLGISLPDLSLLLTEGEMLSLNSLSRLYRIVLLSKSLKISIASLLEMISITGDIPQDDDWTTTSILTFLEHFKLFMSSGIAIDNYRNILNAKVGSEYQLPINAAVINTINEHIAALNIIKDINDREEQKTALAGRIESVIQSFTGNELLRAAMADDLTHKDDLALKGVIESYLGEKNKEALLLLTPEELIKRLSVLQSSFEAYLFWKNTPLIFATLGFDADKIKWLKANKEQTATQLLWVENIDFTNADTYKAFRNLLYLAKLDKIKTGSASWTVLMDVAIKNEATAKAECFKIITEAYAVSEANLDFLTRSQAEENNEGRLNLNFPDDFKNAKNLLSIILCSSIIDKLGGNSEQVRSLLKINSEADDAQAAKNLLKTRYGNTEWLTIIKPVNGDLRIKRRNTLIAWLLANAGTFGWNDTNDLYEDLLIDVEMDACMITSRLKQAISSVQLFIDRCLMNLEQGITLNDDFAIQWHTWRKQYRVWEANRKIFLYPENWIEPDLRDDKSPFFKELESKLRQNDVTDDVVKDALIAYLEKLDMVANLEMVGLFNDEERGIVHVFGRTPNIPHQYFHRELQNRVWSAWKKVEVDIEGDHILPVVWNGRLMLFWGQFTEKQEETGGSSAITPIEGTESMSLTSKSPIKYLEMKLAWSEHKSGKWAGKKISKDAVELKFYPGIDEDWHPTFTREKGQCSLFSAISDGRLLIEIFVTDKENRWKIIYPFQQFAFDGCNNSPVLMDIDAAEKNKMYSISGKTEDYKTNAEKIQVLQKLLMELYVDELGLYKLTNSPVSAKPPVLAGIKYSFELLPNHHRIDIPKEIIFFYDNKRNNFYVYSRSSFKEGFNDDLTNTVGGLIGKRTISMDTFSYSSSVNNASLHSTFRSTDSASVADIPEQIEDISANSFFVESFAEQRFVFQTFYHPYVCEFIKILNTQGINGLYNETIQTRAAKKLFNTDEYGYNTEDTVTTLPYPVEDLDYGFTGTYALYNWELFFHIPLLLATSLSKNQKFEEARKWFHFVFDPTKSSPGIASAERFWITKPFRQEIRDGILLLEDLLGQLGYTEDLNTQLDNWEQHPFNPHAVARLRISSYMRNTVLKYIDNLLAWGDNLFQRDTIESINEATLLYILASNILGAKPEIIPPRASPVEKSFTTIEGQLNPFSNAMVEIESFFTPTGSGNANDNLRMFLFCLPKNDALLKYWDTVADRLFKIRHCMNIEGVVRQLPLFEPPIDPALLVRATAAGLDLNSILNDISAALPNYRFQVMLQKANELCNDVKGLGNELLSALEKKDAEQLALLRSGHELNMLSMVRDIKEKQRDEAEENLNSLNASRSVIEERLSYYNKNVSIYLNPSEKIYFDATQTAIGIQEVLEVKNYLASVLAFTPEFKAGSGFTLGTSFGGSNLAAAAHATINALQSAASLSRLQGESASMKGSYDRRTDEWKFQAKSAERELKQIDKQILAAEIRLAIPEKDLENHDLQMEQSREVDDYMRSKFTNAELYDWMVGQISTVYFQSYQLAYNTAKKAEKCMQHELGRESTSYIQPPYWDSLKKGLLSGEKLQYDLRRLENAYLEENTREYEITKHISLANLNAKALIAIRKDGVCSFQIPEVLFEMDFPRHYFRRIKSIGVSIPCIAGPYTSVSSQLSLNRSFIRTKDNNGALIFDFLNIPDFSDPALSYREGYCRVKAIATSNAQGDTGMFEFNFRDERYLPFEGAGVISDWNLELPTEARQFDYNSISDVIITVRYTARESTDSAFKSAVNAKIRDTISTSIDLLNNKRGLYRLLSLRNDFPDEFYQMKSDNSAEAVNKELKIGKMFFPYFVSNYNIIFKSCMFYNRDGSAISSITVTNDGSETIDDEWKLSINYSVDELQNREDIYLLLNYSLAI